MQSYVLRAVVEPDDDRWVAYCPALKEKGAAAWGKTWEEALLNLEEVTRMVIESLVEYGEPLPTPAQGEISVFPDPRLAITIANGH